MIANRHWPMFHVEIIEQMYRVYDFWKCRPIVGIFAKLVLGADLYHRIFSFAMV